MIIFAAMVHSLRGIAEDLMERRQEQIEFMKAGAFEGLRISNVYGSFRSLLYYYYQQVVGEPFVLVAADKEEAAYIQNDLEAICGEGVAYLFPAAYRKAYQTDSLDKRQVMVRTEALNAIQQGSCKFLISYPEALIEKVPSKERIESQTLTVKVNDTLSIDFLIDLLIDLDFEREDFVYEAGTYAIRGGIVDVFSFAHDRPLRLEFDGDKLVSIRVFDPLTQLSTEEKQVVQILGNPGKSEDDTKLVSVFSVFPRSPYVFLGNTDGFTGLLTQAKLVSGERAKKGDAKLEDEKASELFLSAEAFKVACKSGAHYYIDSVSVGGSDIDFQVYPAPVIRRNYEVLAHELSAQQQEGGKSLVLFPDESQHERLVQILAEQHTESALPRPVFTPVLQMLQSGFSDKVALVNLYTTHEIFDRYRRHEVKGGFSQNQAVTLKELSDMQPGDYVTHIDHGVGQFAGLERLDVNGKAQEAVKILFKGGDAVYVSIHSLHRLSRHSGKDGSPPVLNKLGSPVWQNTKNKTRKRLKEMAFDLLSLYARRKSEQGHSFSGDNYMMHALEASFTFEETPDQHKAIVSVKADMEKPYPMDRLVCGDVGFGKTEVAVRAAFKAACDGKQVVVLVPTTILALQHYKTFMRRFRDMPVKVEYMNRFRSSAKIREIKQQLASGEIDVVIGTHKLLGNDIKFKDLGLLIIDEEQKFGVNAKDKLKTLRVNLDTLTLTATPIPRTLQFSLMGARDLSILRTPPANRYPIHTELCGFNESFLAEIIRSELQRNGQVFFLHNRVQNILEIAGMLSRLVPDAKVGVAHGQMEGKQLEEIMLSFIEGDFDILVSTSIIENGLDVPNANTIIIHQAQNFGLSDLHQMRGRVGRSNRKAYCYLITPPLESLPQDSRRRLQALVDFSELGSGFNIALKDLDLRGAGDLLGADQSGFIQDLGYEAYQRLLADAVRELKETDFKEVFQTELADGTHDWVEDCQVETDLEILIPETYVDQIAERLLLYKALNQLQNELEISKFTLELQDRFGNLPEAVLELIESVRLRKAGRHLGIERIVIKQGKMICYFPSSPQAPLYSSELFGELMHRVLNFSELRLNQKNNRLSLVVERVESVKSAYTWLLKLSPFSVESLK
jgi:transcription-repair coupling factor (superfamily II helicase)